MDINLTDTSFSAGPPVLGTCGEKEIVLNVETPNFVEYKLLETDPVVSPFIFEYKGAIAQASDIGVN